MTPNSRRAEPRRVRPAPRDAGHGPARPSGDELPEAVFLEMGAARERIDLARIGVEDEVTASFAAGREGLTFVASRVSAMEFFLGGQRAGFPVGIVYAPT